VHQGGFSLHDNIFALAVCPSYLVFNLFNCSVRGIKIMQSKSGDNESP